jgi:hypothetical protein
MAHLPSSREGAINVAMKVHGENISDNRDCIIWTHITDNMQMVLGWVLPSQAPVPAGTLSFPRDMFVSYVFVSFDLVERAWGKQMCRS